MAIIIKIPEELNRYQRLLLESAFINVNGLYLATLVYKDKNERIKEKLRESLINSFFVNYENKKKELSPLYNLEESSLSEVQLIELENFSKIHYILTHLEKILYHYESDENRITVSESSLLEAEKYGFERIWYTDPVVLIRKDIIRIEDYKKQDFTLDSFYNLLKTNVYTDSNGNLLVEDDL